MTTKGGSVFVIITTSRQSRKLLPGTYSDFTDYTTFHSSFCPINTGNYDSRLYYQVEANTVYTPLAQIYCPCAFAISL